MKSLCFIAVLLATSPLAAQQPVPAGGESIREEIERLNRSLMEAWQKGDAKAVAAHYSDDARIIGPGSTVEGRTAIDSYWQRFPMTQRTWTLEVIEAGGTREVAYQYGRSTISGGPRSMTVDFIGIWKRQPDGELKLAVDYYWMPARQTP